MNKVSAGTWTTESSDAELIAAVRGGDSTAFGTLFERHEGAASRVASKYSLVPSDVDDIVSESFIRVLKVLQEGGGPDLSFRAYLFTVVRRTGLEFIRRDKQVRPNEDMTIHEEAVGYSASSDEESLMEFENSVVAFAFRSLPERWQAILWYTEIEKRTPAEVAPLLGLSANGAAALAYRARSALRVAYLQHHLATTEDTACLSIFDSLSGYVRGELGKRECSRVRAHLAACKRCASLIDELEDVNRALCA
ncbi:MAG: sigma-70 family RNA polymerase sigma factor [Demequinaceae bacterium]|nr:sigma-70 family RNA polymerase sigma factor [Demequinaceae bacterium]